MADLLIAKSLGIPTYPEIDVNDSTTFSRLSDDVKAYMDAHPWASQYHCWVPKLGNVTVGVKS